MGLLGVLLGITMSILAAALYVAKGDRKRLLKLENMVIFECARKKPVADLPEDHVAKLPKLRYRTWNEDAVMPEGVK